MIDSAELGNELENSADESLDGLNAVYSLKQSFSFELFTIKWNDASSKDNIKV